METRRRLSDEAVGPGMPRTAGNSQKLRERQGTDAPSKPPEGTPATSPLGKALLSEAATSVAVCGGGLRKLMQLPS